MASRQRVTKFCTQPDNLGLRLIHHSILVSDLVLSLNNVENGNTIESLPSGKLLGQVLGPSNALKTPTAATDYLKLGNSADESHPNETVSVRTWADAI